MGHFDIFTPYSIFLNVLGPQAPAGAKGPGRTFNYIFTSLHGAWPSLEVCYPHHRFSRFDNDKDKFCLLSEGLSVSERRSRDPNWVKFHLLNFVGFCYFWWNIALPFVYTNNILWFGHKSPTTNATIGKIEPTLILAPWPEVGCLFICDKTNHFQTIQ